MKVFLSYLLLAFPALAFSQDTTSFLSPSSRLNEKKFSLAVGLQAAGYGGSLGALSSAWYAGYPHSGFHTFNDRTEWLQMDKAGHFLTSWYLARINSGLYEWSGIGWKKAAWAGALTGWGYLAAIEMMDGFSGGWGFSWTDFSANTLGAGMRLGQRFLDHSDPRSPLLKGIAKASLKFSFHFTDYPAFRPSLLGKNLAEQILKDYNGQSYWLSFNLSAFLNEPSRFPKWLNLALGYGAEGMISGKDEYVQLENGNSVWIERYRKYYLSLDIDLSRIKTRSALLKALAETFCFIKIPAPALEMSKYGMKAHAFYF